MVPIPGQRFAFIVRLRIEADSSDEHSPPVLRGMLQPIGSDTVRYFSALADLPRLLAELTGQAQPNT